MKKNISKNIISVMVAFAIVLTGFAVTTPFVADEVYATSRTQAEAVAWANARANEHWEINDGSGWTQCTEFVWAYYEYLVGYHVSGHAYQYLTDSYGACPSGCGWTRPNPSNVQPGDVVVWDQYASFNTGRSDYALEYGHIGVVVAVNGNSMTTVEANAGETRGAAGYKYNREVSCISGIIRPNWITDKDAPVIKYAHIENATSSTFDVLFNVYDNISVSSAQIGCWNEKMSIDDAKWYSVPITGGDYGSITVPIADLGGYKDCWYYCNIYAWDTSGNRCDATRVEIYIDGSVPEIKYAHIANATTSSFDVLFNVYDNTSVSSAQIGCWNEKMSIDDAKWYSVPIAGGDYGSITVPIADLGGYKDCWYYCNIYAWDTSGNRCDATRVEIYIEASHKYQHYERGGGYMSNGEAYDRCTVCGNTINYRVLEGYSTSYVKGFKVSKGKGKFTAKWKKQNKKTQKLFSGYQVRWSTDPGMSGAGYRNVGRGKASVSIKGAKKTRYYVQVRTYTGGYYSPWSAMKSVVTK